MESTDKLHSKNCFTYSLVMHLFHQDEGLRFYILLCIALLLKALSDRESKLASYIFCINLWHAEFNIKNNGWHFHTLNKKWITQVWISIAWPGFDKPWHQKGWIAHGPAKPGIWRAKLPMVDANLGVGLQQVVKTWL